MNLVHRAWPGSITGYRKSRTMKVKSQWLGVASVVIPTPGRVNHKETELCCNWDKSLKLMPCWKRKVKKKEMRWRMVNIQNITLNGLKQLEELCMYIITKVGLAQKWHNLMDYYQVSFITTNKQTAVSQAVCHMARSMTCPLYLNSPKKEKKVRLGKVNM